MKRISLLSIALLALASCQVEELASPVTEDMSLADGQFAVYTVGMDADPQTRTSLSEDKMTILWSENDKMNIFFGINNDDKDVMELRKGAGSSVGEFYGPYIESDSDVNNLHQTVIVYPFHEDNTCKLNDDKTKYEIGLTISAEQVYSENTFANGSFPMVGVTEVPGNITIKTKNINSGLKLVLKGNKTIAKVVVVSKNIPLAGPATVLASYGNDPIVSITPETGINSVELDCCEGVELNNENGTVFYITFAPCVSDKDMSVVIYDTEGGYMTVPVKENVSFNRSKFRPMEREYVPETTITDALKEAFAEGGEYTLPMDWTIKEKLILTDKSLALDLNGKTLNITSGSGNGEIMLRGGSLSISNGTIASESKYIFSVYANNGNNPTLNLNDVTISHTGSESVFLLPASVEKEVVLTNIDVQSSGNVFRSSGNGSEGSIVIDGGKYKSATSVFAENFSTSVIFKGNALFSDDSYSKTEWVYTGDTEYPWTPMGVTQPNEESIVVTSKAGIAWVAEQVNTGAEDFAGKTINLMADLDLSPARATRSAAVSNWTPIGTEEKPFKGEFNGNGYTIKNLNLVESEAKEGKAFIGFFGYAKDATIKNVTFENVYINIPCLDIDHSQGHIGAVAGSLEGTSTIENVIVKGDIKVEATVTANGASRVAVVAGGNSYGNVTMKNVHVNANEGSYLKANNNLGALAGQLQGKSVFENCSSNIDVTGTKFFAGGIIGIAAGDQVFTNCHTTGDVTITAGRSGRANDHYRVGGIAGGWADGKTKVCTLTDCSYTGKLSGKNADGSVAEVFDYAGYVGRGYTLNNCAGSKVVIDGVEYVQVYNTAAEAGIYTVNGVYEIATASALKIFAVKVNAEDTFEGKTVRLVADLDLNNEQWTPIGYWQTFNGTFDGQGHTISNLYHHGTEEDCYVGLFGYTENATIKNLVINNVDLKLVANADWAGGHMGALVGNIDGATVIENITVTGDVKIDGDLTKKGAGRIGGVVGGNTCNATLKNVVVNANEGSFINGNSSVGGIAGQLQGQIEFVNCSSNINVTAQQFYAGGIIGLAAAKTTFTNCTADGNISVLAGRAGNANDLYRVGGIAGGWDDNVTSPLVLSGCSHNCTLSGKTADDKTATYFDCAGFVGRGYSAVKDAKVNVNGHEYIYQGNGVYSVDGTMIVFTAEQLQTVLDNATSDLTVCFSNDIKGNVTVNQKEGVNVLIDGNKKKFDGTIYVNGHSRYNGAETLKIQFVNFESDTVVDFISSNDSNDSVIRYAHNIVVENCSFVGTASSAVAIRTRQAYNISVKNCTATLGHSFAQLNSTAGFSAEAVTVTAGRGFNLGNSNTEATFNGCVVTATKEDGYGIRFDAGAELNVANCKVAAYEPVVFRNCTAACQFNLTSSELNAASGYHVVVASGSTPVMNGVDGLNIK